MPTQDNKKENGMTFVILNEYLTQKEYFFIGMSFIVYTMSSSYIMGILDLFSIIFPFLIYGGFFIRMINL